MPFITNIQIIDDSAVVRALLTDLIHKLSNFKVVAASINGTQGVADYKLHKPEVVLMDIDMPEKDGITALREILAYNPCAKIIMCSSLTQSGAEISIEALSIGAVDFLSKPSSYTIDHKEDFIDNLYRLLSQFSEQPFFKRSKQPCAQGFEKKLDYSQAAPTLILRPLPKDFAKRPINALVIGASTGGPKALVEILSELDKKIPFPVFITQHIPEGFSASLARHIEKITGFPTHEAQQDMVIDAGHVYLATGGKHMGVTPGHPARINLMDTPKVNFCKPSVDVMLESVSQYYNEGIISVILTGLGVDGKNGAQKILEHNINNIVIAQDEDTSLVWGMPGAVAHEGLCHAVLPLNDIPKTINQLVSEQFLQDHK